jgi:hypothetical protein
VYKLLGGYIDPSISFQHVPILRYLSREVGGYDGKSSYEKYIVDAVSDLYIDWRVSPPLALRVKFIASIDVVLITTFEYIVSMGPRLEEGYRTVQGCLCS